MAAILDSNMAAILDSNISRIPDLVDNRKKLFRMHALNICLNTTVRFLTAPEANLKIVCRNKPEMAAILDSNVAAILDFNISNTQDLR